MRAARACVVVFVLAALVAARTRTASAQTANVNVTLTPQGQQIATELGEDPSSFTGLIQSEIDSIYQTTRIGPLLDAFLATTQFANKSLGVDYQTQPFELELGAVADGALSSDVAFASGGHITTGAIVNIGAMVGANFARWGVPRLSVFANGFYETGSLKSLAGHLLTLGLHAQYKVILPSAPGAVRWSGLDVTSGLELARWTLGNTAPIVTKFTIHGASGESRNLTLTSTGSLSVLATTFTVPIEATTGIRFGDVFAIYGGGGIDLTTGSSSITAALDGSLVTTDNDTAVGTVDITATGHANPPVFDVHALAGLQLDVPHFHFFVEGLIAPDVYGASVGFRVSN